MRKVEMWIRIIAATLTTTIAIVSAHNGEFPEACYWLLWSIIVSDV